MAARRAAAGAALVGAVAGALFVWRVLSWPVAASFDAWAYAAWGQALARGERPDYELALTTPKPLAMLLGALVAPLPPGRGLAVVVALALGVLAGALFLAAARGGGALAGAAAVAVLAVGLELDAVLWFALIDGVAAALVLAAVAVRGGPRVALLVAAGLLRPEAWPLAGVAAAMEVRRPLPTRLAAGALAAALPAVLWLGIDLAVSGDALAVSHRTDAINAMTGHSSLGLDVAQLPGVVWRALLRAAAAPVVVLGVLGFALALVRARRDGERSDWLPLAVLVAWPAVLAVEIFRGLPANERYLLPVAGVLALGCGLLIAPLAARLPALAAPVGVAAALGALALALAGMRFDETARISAAKDAALAASLPPVERVLECGRLQVVGNRTTPGVAAQLAAATREPQRRFGLAGDPGRYAGVLRIGRGGTLPAWPRQRTALGPLAVRPGCPASAAR